MRVARSSFASLEKCHICTQGSRLQVCFFSKISFVPSCSPYLQFFLKKSFIKLIFSTKIMSGQNFLQFLQCCPENLIYDIWEEKVIFANEVEWFFSNCRFGKQCNSIWWSSLLFQFKTWMYINVVLNWSSFLLVLSFI